MTLPKRSSNLTAEEYLAREESSTTVKHEYVDGQVFAMTGATRRHRIITGNIYTALRSLVHGIGCNVDFTDALVPVQATNSFYYPDVVLSCGSLDQDSLLVGKPLLIVEVLSRSTTGTDRREKVVAYRKIESLNEYMIVHQKRQRVELHRRMEDGSWTVLEFTQGDLVLLSIPLGAVRISLEVIYEGVSWTDNSDWRVREQPATEDYLEDW